MPEDKQKSQRQRQKEKVDRRRRMYQECFNTDAGKEVLADLAKFCGASRSSFSRDSAEMAFREGRREVFLRVQQHMKITEDDIWNLFERTDVAEN